MSTHPAIAAATEIRPGRYPQYDEVDLHRLVLQKFFQDWPHVSPRDLDGVLAAPTALLGDGRPEVAMHEILYDELRIHPVMAETMYAGGATYALMVQRAVVAIQNERANAILCITAGKFPSVRAGAGERTAQIASHPDFEYIYGAYIPAIYALVATRYMHEYGITSTHLARVAVAERQWALLHPDALMREKGLLSVEDVLASRMIATPFHLFDCSVPCEGGAAVLVTSETLAKRINPQPAYVMGTGEYHSDRYISQRQDFSVFGSQMAGSQAFTASGLTPKDVRVLELYDSFTINPLIYLEDLGMCGRGESGSLVMEGRIDPGGDIPVNTYGGLLSFGHTGDASGMSMVVEGALQTMGAAGARQVEDANVVLVHTHGGMMSEHATLILGRHP